MDTILNDAASKPFLGKPFTVQNLFRDISPKTGKMLAKIKRRKTFRRNECIYSTGESPNVVYFLLEGEARLFLSGNYKSHQIVRNIKPSEILGLPETIANFPYETGIETVSPCVCEYIPRVDFLKFLESDETVCFRLLSMLALNLQESYQHFSSANISTFFGHM